MEAKGTPPLLCVDGPWLLYRSFFGLPKTIKGRDDRPVGALLGSINLILTLVAEHGPRAVIFCDGAEAAAYRTAAYPGYHAGREPPPDALAWQFERAPGLWQAFGWGYATTTDFEADDLLGSYAQVETAAGGRTLLLTGDRDMYQCVGDRVAVLYPERGRDGPALIDAAAVVERYGVHPGQVTDFIALRGDPSDGLPGARGIGAKTAAALLAEHGDLEGVLAAAPASGRFAATLREQAGELRAFKRIATLVTLDVERPADRTTDLASGAAAADALGMRALARRLRS